MENVKQDHGRNHENRYDQNRKDVDREARNRENQSSHIQDPNNFDTQTQYNAEERSHFEGDKLQNRNKPYENPERREEALRKGASPDENNPAPNRKSNDDEGKRGDNRHNL